MEVVTDSSTDIKKKEKKRRVCSFWMGSCIVPTLVGELLSTTCLS